MKQILLAVMAMVMMTFLVTAAFSQETQIQPQPDPNCALTQITVRTQYGSYEEFCGWEMKWLQGGALRLMSPEGEKRFFSGYFEVWVWPAK